MVTTGMISGMSLATTCAQIARATLRLIEQTGSSMTGMAMQAGVREH
ncbi:hypothetical protein ACK2KU_006619 [Pseudomonas aeruginosa]